MRWKFCALAAVVVAGGLLAPPPVRAGAVAPGTYYVAMGDSIASGLGVASSDAYVNRVFQQEQARIPSLRLKNFACSGATTQTVLNGTGCGAGSQLGRVKTFLRAHAGQVAFLTIDLGINDVRGLANPDPAKSLSVPSAAIEGRLTRILAGLESAYPKIKVFGMNYYDPVLAYWLAGPAGRVTARLSATAVANVLNPLLARTYKAAGFRTADVSRRFHTTDFSLTGKYQGRTVPRNVADVCVLTRMCARYDDIHPNAAGHAAIALAFEAVIDRSL